ncbi:nuclear transport factor 2 family protein [Paenibacillus sp. tmac-D7]|uniref:nuclear transport factor 2 family protein n=1 Tax=Paenibacillus sp. tmac-D7 TaxID=2591462 RepID=UPI001142F3C2|nr:nuclear transport factor 2 family protein [Paenibacillus sp. tmac-D7]
MGELALNSNEHIATLEKKIEQLTNQVGLLEDTQAIRHLHHKYGYYIDKCLYNEVVDLFAEDGEVHFMGGIFKGKEGARRLYVERFQKNFTNGNNGPVYGFLLDHPMMQDIVEVSPDRQTAKGRFRCLMQAGRHELAEGETRQWWEGGIYENEYVKEQGVWKIKVLNYRGLWHADFDKGWAHTPPGLYPMFSTTFPENPVGPDELIVPTPVLWPDTDVMAFHYPHPVTGQC